MATETKWEAGPELDYQIAVMLGCTPRRTGGIRREWWECDCPDGQPSHYPLSNGESGLAPYSTDIAEAWRVVEYLTAEHQGWKCDFQWSNVGGWAMFTVVRNNVVVNATAEWAGTAPLTICRAAIATKEVQP